jgi:hypothetical protein
MHTQTETELDNEHLDVEDGDEDILFNRIPEDEDEEGKTPRLQASFDQLVKTYRKSERRRFGALRALLRQSCRLDQAEHEAEGKNEDLAATITEAAERVFDEAADDFVQAHLVYVRVRDLFQTQTRTMVEALAEAAE